jgi:PTH1 family peptidyl-tRNA hydrolase
LKIVLGLGNPGDRYRWTRHNVGFRVVDLLAQRWGALLEAKGELGERALWCRAEYAGSSVLLAKPRTYMNRSGSAAIALVRKVMAAPEELLVVFDDADLEVGRVRVRSEGSPGGHNGLKSLQETLGSRTYPRVKLGVKGAEREESDLADYVLRPFEEAEREQVEVMIATAADAVECVLRDGLDAAIRNYNAPPARGLAPPKGRC